MQFIRNHVFVPLAAALVLAVCNAAVACKIEVDVNGDYVLKSEDSGDYLELTFPELTGGEGGTIDLVSSSNGAGEVRFRDDGNNIITSLTVADALDDQKHFWVEGITVSNAVADVTVTATLKDAGDQTLDSDTDTVTVIEVHLDLKQTGVGCTTGGGAIAMRKNGSDAYTNDTYASGGDRDISNPLWIDANYNDTPETEDPVCLLKEKTAKLVDSFIKVNVDPNMALTVKIKVEGVPAGHAGTVSNVVFGPNDVNLSQGAQNVTITTLNGNANVGTVVNNFEYDLTWKYSVDGGTIWHSFQDSEQKVFVLLDAPLAGYAGNIGGGNPISVGTTLQRTAKRIDWAATVCEGKNAANIEPGAAGYVNSNYTFSTTANSYHTNPFSSLDTGTKWDCISQASLAATALRINGVDARPARAYSQYKVVPATNTTWGWVVKSHPLNAGWFLGYFGNNFEGYFHIGPFVKWTTFPSKGYTVVPRADCPADAGKEKYLPIYILNAAGGATLTWRFGGADKEDVAWKPGDTPISGVTVQAYGATWTADDTKDGDYNVAWDKDASTLKLDTGAAVSISGDGQYTLTCTHGSIKVDVVEASLPGADDNADVRIVPARTQASVP